MIIDHPKPQVNLSHFSTLLFNCHVTQKNVFFRLYIISFGTLTVHITVSQGQVKLSLSKTVNLSEIIKVKPLKNILTRKCSAENKKPLRKKTFKFISFHFFLSLSK